jgi:flagellar basal body-associated protein FliL
MLEVKYLEDKMKDPKRKSFIFIVIIALIVLAGAAGYLCVMKNKNTVASTTTEPVSTVQTAQPAATSTPASKAEIESEITDAQQTISSVNDDLAKLDQSSVTADTAPSL